MWYKTGRVSKYLKSRLAADDIGIRGLVCMVDGREGDIMAKFCGKCGAKLDEHTGHCPNCDSDIPNHAFNLITANKPREQVQTLAQERKKASDKSSTSNPILRKWSRILLGVAVILAICIAVAIILLHFSESFDVPASEYPVESSSSDYGEAAQEFPKDSAEESFSAPNTLGDANIPSREFTQEDLIGCYWSNNIQSLMAYRFLENGYVEEYYGSPGEAVIEENLMPSGRQFRYEVQDNKLYFYRDEDDPTELELVYNTDNIDWDTGLKNQIESFSSDEPFFYETGWEPEGTGPMRGNAFYLGKCEDDPLLPLMGTYQQEFSVRGEDGLVTGRQVITVQKASDDQVTFMYWEDIDGEASLYTLNPVTVEWADGKIPFTAEDEDGNLYEGIIEFQGEDAIALNLELKERQSEWRGHLVSSSAYLQKEQDAFVAEPQISENNALILGQWSYGDRLVFNFMENNMAMIYGENDGESMQMYYSVAGDELFMRPWFRSDYASDTVNPGVVNEVTFRILLLNHEEMTLEYNGSQETYNRIS